MLIRAPESLFHDHEGIKQKMDGDWNANVTLWQIFQREASINARLESGDTTIGGGNQTGNLGNNASTNWFFNRTRPMCGMVSGRQRQQRKSTIAVPLENGDQHTADQLSKIFLHIYKKQNVYESISEAFHQGSCISGMNLLHVYLDWTKDPINGDIKVDNIPYNYFMIDPYFKKTDLSDCNFVWRRTYLTHTAAANLLPEHYESVMSLPGNPTGMGRDGRFQYAAEATGRAQQNLVSYDEYYYRDYREQKLLVNKETGECRELTEREDLDINLFMEHYPQVEVIKQMIPTVRLAVAVQGKVFYNGAQPLGIDVFPFVPVVGFYNPMLPYFYNRVQSLCTAMRDPQLLLNRRIILSADLLESQTNSGWIFKENAVLDVKHLFQTGQGRIIPLKSTAQMSDIQPITPPQIPPSFFSLQETFSKEMNYVTGINEELLGSAIDDKAGILAALRQGAGLITLQPLFDRLDFAQIQLTDIMMKVIQANYTPGKVRTILEGEEPAPFFYNKAFGQYHCMLELGYNTDTQKQMEFAQLFKLREILGPEIPGQWLLDAAQIQNKEKYMKMAEQQQQQQQQMAQQQQQVQMQEIQSRINLTNARAVADKGLGLERISRINENQALAEERKSAAVKDEQAALLNLARALKELESIDITHLQQLIALQQTLKAMETPKETLTTQPQAQYGNEEQNPTPFLPGM